MTQHPEINAGGLSVDECEASLVGFEIGENARSGGDVRAKCKRCLALKSAAERSWI